MWVEPDTNMPTGESLARQILYGQRFFEKHFGKRHTVCWLPDCFGFSGALPQLLKQGGKDVAPRALALVPTRELAVQVREEFEKLAYGTRLSCVPIYGGKPIRMRQAVHDARGHDRACDGLRADDQRRPDAHRGRLRSDR